MNDSYQDRKIRVSIPEVIGDAGISFLPREFFDFSDTILNLMDHEKLRDEYRASGLERVNEMFDARKNGKKLTEMFENLISS